LPEIDLLLRAIRKAEEGRIEGFAYQIPYFLSHWLFPQAKRERNPQKPGILDSNYLISAISEWTGIPELTIIEKRNTMFMERKRNE